MHKIRLNALELDESYHEDDDDARWLACFPFTAGAAGETEIDDESVTVVYNELEPGAYLGPHRDGTEEVLLLLEGIVEARVDGEVETVEAEELALIPAGTKHSVYNVGDNRARMVGIFNDSSFESVFDREVHPAGTRVFE